ncbi:MAG: flagellar motor protein MotB [Spirochaetales bacterium]|jgi:chemotaxis protein MotB|nr:flagellar motor protein MotB [Spirochaetales bacterium]
MAAGDKKCPKCPPEGAPDWQVTYGDMVTLLLTFFILLYTTAEFDEAQILGISTAFAGMGNLAGGNTLQVGRMAELGHTVMALPAQNRGKALDRARKRAVSEFQPEISTQKVRIQEDERGLVISLAADAYFRPASAQINMEQARSVLIRVADLLTSPELAGRKFRIEGHTDSSPTDSEGPWQSNWELSTARSVNVLHRLVEYGVDENQFQVAGFASTVPLVSEATPEGRAYNRRVDIIILTDGHL